MILKTLLILRKALNSPGPEKCAALAQTQSANLDAATQTLSQLTTNTPMLGQIHGLNLYSLRGIIHTLHQENKLAESDFLTQFLLLQKQL